MEKIGVEAIVSGLTSFLGDMKSIDKSITDLVPSSSLLSKAFQGIGNVVEWLTGSILRVLEYTLGNLISSAIQSVIRSLKELVAGTIEAGNEFQTLQIRLQNFNFNAATESGMEFNDAMKVATEQTQEQLTWLQRLAAQTPYDLTDIANVYTLARSYGFASDESQTLTARIADFAAGMGLGNTEIERIVVNFGQMVQQGKVTQREMNDLARGAFVPVNDVLKLMQEQTGLTGDAFDDFRSSTEGVNAFMTAFSTLVEQRFTGSTQAMARTWKGATDNVKDFVKSIVGLDVVKPILDTLGGYVGDFLEAFTRVPSEAERAVAEMEGITIRDPFEEIVATAKTIGKTISGIITDILGLGPSADDLAIRLVDGVKAFSDWLIAHRGDIVDFVKNSIKSVQDFAAKVKAFIDDKVVPAFKRISDWVSDNKGVIERFFASLSEIFGDVFSDLFGGLGDTDPLGAILEGLKTFMKFVIDNKEGIADFVSMLIKLSVYMTVIDTVAKVVTSALMFLALAFIAILTPLAVLKNLFSIVIGVVQLLGTALAWLSALLMTSTATAFGVLVAAVVGAIAMFKVLEIGFRSIIGAVQILGTTVVQWFTLIKENITRTITESIAAIRNGDWFGAAKAIVEGMYRGVIINLHLFIDALRQLVQNGVEAVKSALGISSPSKVFVEIGTNLVLGLVNGISETSGALLEMLQSIMDQMVDVVVIGMRKILSVATQKFNEVKSALENVDFVSVGVNMISGIIDGIQSMVGSLVSAATTAATSAVNAVNGALAIKSPSRVFYDIGRNTILGMVEGIAATSAMLSNAMRGVAASAIAQGSVIPSAMYSRMAPSNAPTINNTSSYTMNVNTAANHEDIISDFGMLESMNGW